MRDRAFPDVRSPRLECVRVLAAAFPVYRAVWPGGVASSCGSTR